MATPRRHAARMRNARTQYESLEQRVLMTAMSVQLQGVSNAHPEMLKATPGVGHPAQLSPLGSALTLADMHAITGVDIAHGDFGLTGAGQTVAIIDSGVAWDHESLGAGLGHDSRVVGGWDFAEDDANPYDDGPAGFHGTHVTGIAASSHPVHTGVAPGADIVALRVFDDYGRGKMEWIEASLNWIIEHADAFTHPITTVNMSIGTDWNSLSLPDYADLEDELKTLNEMDIFVAVAAGNKFDPDRAGLSYPAASSHVTPAASHGPDGAASDFTQRNARVLLAPGEDVLSTVPDYLEDFNGKADDYFAATGTSMAAPYVAGASMLVREALQQAGHTTVTTNEIEQILFDTADRNFDPATGQSYHRINVVAAVESVLGALQVEHINDKLIVHGTENADRIVLDDAGIVTVNGEVYPFEPHEVRTIQLNGLGGDDKLTLHSHLERSRVSMAAGEVRLWNPTLTIEGDEFEHIEVYAEAELTAQFAGSESADIMFIKPTHSWMESGNFTTYVRGASSVVAWANDAHDRVVMYDSPDDDQFMSRPESARITGANFDHFAVGFHEVAAHSQPGDSDAAEIIGTRDADSVRVRTTGASLKGSQHFAFARGFERTTIDGNGGVDAAKLYDSPDDDRVELSVDRHSIATPTARTSLEGFTRVEVYASQGHDIVVFAGDDSAQRFTAKPTHAWMETGQHVGYARGFDVVSLAHRRRRRRSRTTLRLDSRRSVRTGSRGIDRHRQRISLRSECDPTRTRYLARGRQ